MSDCIKHHEVEASHEYCPICILDELTALREEREGLQQAYETLAFRAGELKVAAQGLKMEHDLADNAYGADKWVPSNKHWEQLEIALAVTGAELPSLRIDLKFCMDAAYETPEMSKGNRVGKALRSIYERCAAALSEQESVVRTLKCEHGRPIDVHCEKCKIPWESLAPEQEEKDGS